MSAFQASAAEVPDLIEIFRRMALIKICDERVRAAARAGKLRMNYYSPRGQEAVAAAVSVHLTPRDYVVTTYRGIHDQLAKGMPLDLLWAEFAGRVTGACKGKGGPMHITHAETGVMVTTGIVGSGMPIANGLALAAQLEAGRSGEPARVTTVNFGDGASNIGAFHEGLNLASVWKLPVIYICQNNGYAEHSHYSLGTSVDQIVKRASSYGCPGIRVNGNDPVAMWQAARQAVERARSGGGPTLIEALTFRFEGHNFGDPGEYIPAEEYSAAKDRDPYPVFRAELIADGRASEDDLEALEASIRQQVDAAAEAALAAPYPDAAHVREDVYAVELSGDR